MLRVSLRRGKMSSDAAEPRTGEQQRLGTRKTKIGRRRSYSPGKRIREWKQKPTHRACRKPKTSSADGVLGTKSKSRPGDRIPEREPLAGALAHELEKTQAAGKAKTSGAKTASRTCPSRGMDRKEPDYPSL
jgi:hypothetical protein